MNYTVELKAAGPRMIAAVHARLPLGSIPSVFTRYLNQVYAAGRAGAVHLDGQNVFLYRPASGQPDSLDVAFGVGITAPFTAVDNVRPTELPVGTVAMTTHWGSYGTLGAAHRAVTEWCRATGYRLAGPSWEIYGHWTEDETQLRTDVYYLIQ